MKMRRKSLRTTCATSSMSHTSKRLSVRVRPPRLDAFRTNCSCINLKIKKKTCGRDATHIINDYNNYLYIHTYILFSMQIFMIAEEATVRCTPSFYVESTERTEHGWDDRSILLYTR